jgi:hypothetical protein
MAIYLAILYILSTSIYRGHESDNFVWATFTRTWPPQRQVHFVTYGDDSFALSRCASCCYEHTSAYVSIRQHTSAYVLLRAYIRRWLVRAFQVCLLLLRAYVSIRQHTSAYVSIRQHACCYEHTSAYVSIRLFRCASCCYLYIELKKYS